MGAVKKANRKARREHMQGHTYYGRALILWSFMQHHRVVFRDIGYWRLETPMHDILTVSSWRPTRAHSFTHVAWAHGRFWRFRRSTTRMHELEPMTTLTFTRRNERAPMLHITLRDMLCTRAIAMYLYKRSYVRATTFINNTYMSMWILDPRLKNIKPPEYDNEQTANADIYDITEKEVSRYG